MSNWPDKKFIPIAQICSPYGFKGWCHIKTFASDLSILTSGQELYFENEKELSLLEIELISEISNKHIAKVIGFDSKEMIASLNQKLIYIHRDSLPDLNDNEYYWQDIIKCNVYDQNKTHIGQVTQMIETGGKDVMVIKGAKKEVLIPFAVNVYVSNVDIENKKIFVEWDE